MIGLRIVADNAISRAALTASSTAGVLTPSNLQIDRKSSVWRATGTAATLTATWTAAEVVACVALPFCNFSQTATIRVRGYSDAAGTNQVLDTGVLLACPAPAARLRGWSAAQAASAYAYGGGAIARVWFGATAVMRLVIDIADANNLQGYVEAACLVAGPVWAPQYNGDGVKLTPVDTTELYRTDGGDQMADAGVIFRRLSVDLSYMPAPDRAAFVSILRQSRSYPILVSPYQGWGDAALEADNTIYGRRAKDSDSAGEYALIYSSSIEIEEI